MKETTKKLKNCSGVSITKMKCVDTFVSFTSNQFLNCGIDIDFDFFVRCLSLTAFFGGSTEKKYQIRNFFFVIIALRTALTPCVKCALKAHSCLCCLSYLTFYRWIALHRNAFNICMFGKLLLLLLLFRIYSSLQLNLCAAGAVH